MQGGPTPQEMEELARKLEAFLGKVNAKFLHEARIDPDSVAQVFVETQATLLQFDEAARARFSDAVEEARVKSLARDNFLMSCLLTSAVALKQFKREPRSASLTGLRRKLAGALKDASTGKTALWMVTLASFYAVLGSAAYKRLVELRTAKKAVVTIRARR